VLKEKIFKRLYKELPYEVQIEDVSYQTLLDGSIRIEKNLMVCSDQVTALPKGPPFCVCASPSATKDEL
jgi:GTPase Era involved in 16S rRNA processing